jgi:multidrug efflux pump subunit AcrB
MRQFCPQLFVVFASEQPSTGSRREAFMFGRLYHGFERGFDRLRGSYKTLLSACLENRQTFASTFLLFCLAGLLLATHLGEDFFPTVDAGQFRLQPKSNNRNTN